METYRENESDTLLLLIVLELAEPRADVNLE